MPQSARALLLCQEARDPTMRENGRSIHLASRRNPVLEAPVAAQFEFLREPCEGSPRTLRLKAGALAGKSKAFNREVREGTPRSSRRDSQTEPLLRLRSTWGAFGAERVRVLLQMPDKRQCNHHHTQKNPVHDENLQAV